MTKENKDLATQHEHQPGAGRHALNPFSTFRSEVSDLFDRFNRDFFSRDLFTRDWGPWAAASGDIVPKIEVRDKGDAYLLRAELPGLKQDEINVSLRDNSLIIEGERRTEKREENEGHFRTEFSYGSFYRAIPLYEDVKADTIEAKYQDGILQIKMEKQESQSSKARKIPINQTRAKDAPKH